MALVITTHAKKRLSERFMLGISHRTYKFLLAVLKRAKVVSKEGRTRLKWDDELGMGFLIKAEGPDTILVTVTNYTVGKNIKE